MIVSRLTAPVKGKLGRQRYVGPRRGVEVAGIGYQLTGWPDPYRFVVVGRAQPEQPTDQLAKCFKRLCMPQMFPTATIEILRNRILLMRA